MGKRLHVTVRCGAGLKPKDSIEAALSHPETLGTGWPLCTEVWVQGGRWGFFPNKEKPVYTGIFFNDEAFTPDPILGKHVTWMFGKGCTLPEGIEEDELAYVQVVGYYAGPDYEVIVVRVKVNNEWAEFQP